MNDEANSVALLELAPDCIILVVFHTTISQNTANQDIHCWIVQIVGDCWITNSVGIVALSDDHHNVRL